MVEKYNVIINALKEANAKGDLKAIKRLRNKLTKWQLSYGAYAPITSNNYNKYD